MLPPYDWPLREDFLNRTEDLARLEDWWLDSTRDAMCLYGRRRVGKSWLFHRFADGKPALILVGERLTPAAQLTRFATEIQTLTGFRPDLPDVPELIKFIYQLGRDEKILVVVDEFPYLLPDGAARTRLLTAIQAVMEQMRDRSKTKLLLCGSLIAQMQSLLEMRSPLHGRLQPLEVRPMTFAESQPFFDSKQSVSERVTRFSVTGGMARYLAELGRDGSLRELVRRRVFAVRGQLFDDPRVVLQQELRQPATYFSILETLAEHDCAIDTLTNRLGVPQATLNGYLATLEQMRIISSELPVGSHPGAKGRRFKIDDGFIRFWFRFVFPRQEALATGLPTAQLWDGEVSEFLPEHTAVTFEDLCQRYTRIRFGLEAPTIGRWWGSAMNKHRRSGLRYSEEIDVVGIYRRRLKLIGECKWNNRKMSTKVLEDLLEYKLPALLEHTNLTAPKSHPEIVLFSRAGFDQELHAQQSEFNIHLVDLEELGRVLGLVGK